MTQQSKRKKNPKMIYFVILLGISFYIIVSGVDTYTGVLSLIELQISFFSLVIGVTLGLLLQQAYYQYLNNISIETDEQKVNSV